MGTIEQRTALASSIGKYFGEQVVYDKDGVKISRSAVADRELGEAARLISLAVNKIKDASKQNYRDECYSDDSLLDLRRQAEECAEAINKIIGR